MRYLVHDEDGVLLRKFWDKESAQRYLQEGWRITVLPKPSKRKPTVEEFGEALW